MACMIVYTGVVSDRRTCVAGRSGVSSSIAGAFKHVSSLRTPASVLTGVRDTPAGEQRQFLILQTCIQANSIYLRIRTEAQD